MHSAQIIDCASPPVSPHCEEAQEPRNKEYKQFRMDHSSKTSLAATIEDVLMCFCVIRYYLPKTGSFPQSRSY